MRVRVDDELSTVIFVRTLQILTGFALNCADGPAVVTLSDAGGNSVHCPMPEFDT